MTWLREWKSIGGGITISADGKVAPWRVDPPGATASYRELADRLQRRLLGELDQVTGLADGVKVLTLTNADTLPDNVARFTPPTAVPPVPRQRESLTERVKRMLDRAPSDDGPEAA